MIMSEKQSAVLDAIKPDNKKKNKKLVAHIPAKDILAFKYASTIPILTDTYKQYNDELQELTKKLFIEKSKLLFPDKLNMPSKDALKNCAGKWTEYAFGVIAWNELAKINKENSVKGNDSVYLYVKLPNSRGNETKWTSLLADKYKDALDNFENYPTDEEKKNAGHESFILYASNPDAVILKYSSDELSAIKLAHDPNDTLTNISLASQDMLDRLFEKLQGTVTPSKNIVAFLSVKNSSRSDRRYQFVHEGDSIKSHLMYLHAMRIDRIGSYANKYYAVCFNKISNADKAIMNIASAACVSSSLLGPIWSVDNMFECKVFLDGEKILRTVIYDNEK